MARPKSTEKPLPYGARVYIKHKKIARRWSKADDVSESHIVRVALEEYNERRIKEQEEKIPAHDFAE